MIGVQALSQAGSSGSCVENRLRLNNVSGVGGMNAEAGQATLLRPFNRFKHTIPPRVTVVSVVILWW